MQSKAATVDIYIDELPKDRKLAISKLRKIINDNIPPWFEEGMGYGMMWRDIPHSVFPAWYHCDPSKPLPFAGIASQKNNISFYHMWLYALPELLERFLEKYREYSDQKLDMGKSCIRRKKAENIPYELIWQLMTKVTAKERIACYQNTLDTRTKIWKKS